MEVIPFLIVAGGITKLVDFIRNAFDKNDSWPKWAWNVAPFAFGLLSAFILNVELATPPEGILRINPSEALLRVATGLGLGAFASGWHELWDMWSSRGSTPGA
jgi:hypothetical protein